jgi:hypothetical protein
MTGNIATINVPQSGLVAYIDGPLDAVHRGGSRIEQPVCRVETGDMPGKIRRDRDQEFRQAGQFVVAVV